METKLHFETIPQYPEYGISKCGQVKNLKTGNLLTSFVENGGYYRLNLYREDRKRNYRESIHRLLAMTYMGYEPTDRKTVVDHINNNPSDNRLENLQIISQRLNSTKDKVRDLPTGVQLNRNGKRYVAKISETHDGIKRNHHLGTFDTIEEASSAYQKAASLMDYLNLVR